MKILQINCTYREGSTGKIVYLIHTGLIQEGIESSVCYGRGERADSDPNVRKICSNLYAKLNNLRSRITGLMYGGCILSTHRLIRYIEEYSPDVVHLHCINGYFVNIYLLISWLNSHHIKTILTLHAEFMYTGNCGHALDCDGWLYGCGHCPRLHTETLSWFVDGTAKSFKKMYQAFSGFQDNLTVVSVSEWLMERAKKSPILSKMDHRVIYNGVDTSVFTYIPKSEARARLGLKNEKIVFHATAMFSDSPEHLKGGYYVIELAKSMPNVIVLVAGKNIIKANLPANVVLLGEINDQSLLATYYNAADITVIASKKETFSMICAESLCCGTPVVGFKAGGPEQISLEEYSEFVEHGNLKDLVKCVDVWLGKAFSRQEIAQHASEKYSNIEMYKKYFGLYREQIS